MAVISRLQVLDCTLRDGGYCNEWKFGFENIKQITKGLIEAEIDIVECGFLTNKVTYDKDKTKFTDVNEVAKLLPSKSYNKLFVVMINYGEYKIEDIPMQDQTGIDGIRVAFHKKDYAVALRFCEEIKLKGYKVFVQPMVSVRYTDSEFIDLITITNQIEPYAFYIVDSFGMMKYKDLLRLFYIVEHNLNENIWIGFHAHNNLQLAYSNAQRLVEIQTKRKLIIDTSVHGMGRGAGNCNTELFVEYLNEYMDKKYVVKPLLTIIDDILNGFYQNNTWGYSLPNYLSASYAAHPNYASFLDDKKTLTVEAMSEIFELMDDNKRYEFDKEYIESLYLQYMNADNVQGIHRVQLQEILQEKTILLIGPGCSSVKQKDIINGFILKEKAVTISVNVDYLYSDYIFVSNLRRFRELDNDKHSKCIVTSNIPTDDVYLRIKYGDLLNEIDIVKDNAGMMAINFLIKNGVRKVYLAGFDGYSHDFEKNYAENYMSFITRKAMLDAMNEGINKVLSIYSKEIEIIFLTDTKYTSTV